jgi:hypothetical protein
MWSKGATMWEVNGVEVSVDWLDPEPVEVLYEYDGPRIFTCRDRDGWLFLVYQCGEKRDTLRFLAVPFSEGQVWGLTRGHSSLLDALLQSRARVIDLGKDWRCLRCWEVDIGTIPAHVLPAPGVMLWAHSVHGGAAMPFPPAPSPPPS